MAEIRPATVEAQRPGAVTNGSTPAQGTAVPALLEELRANGATTMFDQRAKGGCLWVVDGPGAREAVARVARERGVRFYFKAPGPRCADFRPAWWTLGK
ncbi:hypothetical protein LBMAG42_56810 [Deltaproteobacteria bacterium]|nr:hypothetical protein LBMAG42_56810 [Deltaproteobacteria bacterium]